MYDQVVKCSVCPSKVSRGRVNGYGECDACGKARRKRQEANVAAQPAVTINIGDLVRIKCEGRSYTGTVTFADDCGGELGWTVQFLHADGRGPGYWKQGPDGGTIEKL